MKLYNINNEHVKSHRYGWDKIINTVISEINSDIILIDYMDKYFNPLFFEKKIIYVNKQQYTFLYKDAYYYKYDPKKEDVFIYYDTFDFLHIFKWYSEYNEFKIMRGFINTNDFIKKYHNFENIESPWIGILHYPEFKKSMNYTSSEELINIIKSEYFLNSLKHCKCIITLSNHLNVYCKQILKQNKINNIDIKTIYHPTDFDCKQFNYSKFIKNKSKKLIQIGFWLRKCDTIYKIKSNKYIKYWLPGGDYWLEYTSKIYNNYINLIENENIIIKLNLSNIEYDELLSENIVIINVFNSSANNTILECIVRNTPILTNNHPAIREYLGSNYPLYYNSIKELNEIIDSSDFNKKIKTAHEYLKQLDKSKYNINNFVASIKKITELHDILKIEK